MVTGVCVLYFSQGGVSGFGLFFFLHLNIFKQQNKDYLLKRENYFLHYISWVRNNDLV